MTVGGPDDTRRIAMHAPSATNCSAANVSGPDTPVRTPTRTPIVTAPTVAEACYKAATFERMCRFTYDALAAGHDALELPPDARAAMKPVLRQNAPQAYWDGAVRLLLRTEAETIT